MRGNMLVGCALILVLCLFSCSDLGVEIRKDPSGTFDFARYNSTGNILTKGTLTISLTADSTISGEWNITNGNNGGVLYGWFRNGFVSLDFTSGCLSCVDYVKAQIVGNGLDGKWYTGFQATLTDSGRFVATRR